MSKHGPGDIILDIGLALLTISLILWGWHLIKEEITYRKWLATLTVADPADVEVWHVLAEARRITEEAARGDA